jgi:putative transposase
MIYNNIDKFKKRVSIVARRIRVFIENTAQHIILKGINEIDIFQDDIDYKIFISFINEIKSLLKIHSYILMPKYFEFLATPINKESLPKFMQILGRKYVRYFNKKYNRKGTLWEGRYKSSIVEDSYILYVMKYIESLPVKEKIVDNAIEYKYSSIHCNLLNKKDRLIKYHEIYKKLGYRDSDRIKIYSQIFYDNRYDKFIKQCLEKQLITGNLEYIKKLEKLIGIRLREKKRGRPKKHKKGKKMYKKLTILDKKNHKNLKITPIKELSFAKKITFIPILAKEIELIGKDFPIVFTTDENPSIVALVSLGGDNLAIDHQGKWITNYIPAFIRKYPFAVISANDNPKQKLILIDEESPVVSFTQGEPLFKEDGTQTKLLQNRIKFLSEYEKEMELTKKVTKLISDSKILEDREISMGEGEEKHILVNGFKIIDREKLNNLSDDILADWVRRGIITLIDTHIKSLNNIDKLFNLAQKRQN